jgi:hypothetical protein
MKRMQIPAKLLANGDVIITSRRYGQRVRGPVELGVVSGNLVSLIAPTLPDEDVAFQANDSVDIRRPEEPA